MLIPPLIHRRGTQVLEKQTSPNQSQTGKQEEKPSAVKPHRNFKYTF